VKIEKFLVHGSERRQLANPGVRKDHVDLPIVPFDCFVQMIKIAQVANIALHSCHIPADLSNRRVQHVLSAACNKDVIHAFLNKAPGSGQAHSS
jgi:hypothetical protein